MDSTSNKNFMIKPKTEWKARIKCVRFGLVFGVVFLGDLSLFQQLNKNPASSQSLVPPDRWISSTKMLSYCIIVKANWQMVSFRIPSNWWVTRIVVTRYSALWTQINKNTISCQSNILASDLHRTMSKLHFATLFQPFLFLLSTFYLTTSFPEWNNTCSIIHRTRRELS